MTMMHNGQVANAFFFLFFFLLFFSSPALFLRWRISRRHRRRPFQERYAASAPAMSVDPPWPWFVASIPSRTLTSIPHLFLESSERFGRAQLCACRALLAADCVPPALPLSQRLLRRSILLLGRWHSRPDFTVL